MSVSLILLTLYIHGCSLAFTRCYVTFRVSHKRLLERQEKDSDVADYEDLCMVVQVSAMIAHRKHRQYAGQVPLGSSELRQLVRRVFAAL